MEPEADGLKCMDVACNPQRIAGRCGKAQMMPYWASSCSSRWLKASQGQMTVISTTQSQMWLNRLLRARQACLKCFSRSVVYLPVPKPSIPGMSSPKLQRQRDYKACLVIRCKALQTDSDWMLTYPWMPFFGGLLLNWRVCLCLNLGGPLRGVAGPPLTRVADLISALGSRFMLSS